MLLPRDILLPILVTVLSVRQREFGGNMLDLPCSGISVQLGVDAA